jgi:hypothetical protein
MKLKIHEQEYETIRQSIMDEWGYNDDDMDDEEIENEVNREADEQFEEKFGISYLDAMFEE